MTSSELGEHLRYHTDQHRTDAYRGALNAIVSDGDTVLDLGSGTGLLGFLALNAGAGHVHAVDRGPIIGLSREIASDAHLADRVTFHRTSSTALNLDGPPDVVVCDQIGGFVHDAGVLRFYRDVADRLAGPNTRFVPESFEFHCVPVQDDEVRGSIDGWIAPISQMPTGIARERAVNTEHRIGTDSEHLARSVVVGRRESTDSSAATMVGDLTIEAAGRLDGIVGFFTANLGGGVAMTNDPKSPSRINRWCNFYPIASPTTVRPGDTVHVSFDLRPELLTIGWSVTINHSDGASSAFRHSSMLGQFLSHEDIRGASVVVNDKMRQATLHALELADGRRTASEISAAVWSSHPDAFVSAGHCSDVITGVLKELVT